MPLIAVGHGMGGLRGGVAYPVKLSAEGNGNL